MELNRIYCCDNVEGMKRYLPDESIDLTVTSPPYDNLQIYENTLGWNPKWNIDKAVEKTVEFTKDYLEGKPVGEIMTRQINEFFGE